METTIVYWGYIGIMEKKMETTSLVSGFRGFSFGVEGPGTYAQDIFIKSTSGLSGLVLRLRGLTGPGLPASRGLGLCMSDSWLCLRILRVSLLTGGYQGIREYNPYITPT